jgi:hypothetical protein
MCWSRSISLTLGFLLILTAVSPSKALAQEADRIEPVSIRVQRSLIEAPVESIEIVEGVAQETTGFWTVGWYQASAPLGQPGNSVYFGFKELGTAGPGIFWYLDQTQPGDLVLATGSNGLVYRYEVIEVATFPMETALFEVFGETPEAEHRITLFTNANWDPAASEYTAVLVVRAIWSPDDEPRPAAQEAATATGLERCSGIEQLPQQSLYAATQELGVSEGTLTSTSTVENIDQMLRSMPECEFVIREAVTLPDGNVLALVGPTGEVPLTVLTGAVDAETQVVTDQQRVSLFAYALFVNEGDTWTVYVPPMV